MRSSSPDLDDEGYVLARHLRSGKLEFIRKTKSTEKQATMRSSSPDSDDKEIRSSRISRWRMEVLRKTKSTEKDFLTPRVLDVDISDDYERTYSPGKQVTIGSSLPYVPSSSDSDNEDILTQPVLDVDISDDYERTYSTEKWYVLSRDLRLSKLEDVRKTKPTENTTLSKSVNDERILGNGPQIIYRSASSSVLSYPYPEKEDSDSLLPTFDLLETFSHFHYVTEKIKIQDLDRKVWMYNVSFVQEKSDSGIIVKVSSANKPDLSQSVMQYSIRFPMSSAKGITYWLEDMAIFHTSTWFDTLHIFESGINICLEMRSGKRILIPTCGASQFAEDLRKILDKKEISVGEKIEQTSDHEEPGNSIDNESVNEISDEMMLKMWNKDTVRKDIEQTKKCDGDNDEDGGLPIERITSLNIEQGQTEKKDMESENADGLTKGNNKEKGQTMCKDWFYKHKIVCNGIFVDCFIDKRLENNYPIHSQKELQGDHKRKTMCKDWFYKHKIVCNGIFVECCVDKRLENNYPIHYIHAQKAQGDHEVNSWKWENEFHMILDSIQILLWKHSNEQYEILFKQAVKKYYGLCCRLLLNSTHWRVSTLSLAQSMLFANTSKGDMLSLGDARRCRDVVKALAWEITRRFYSDYKHMCDFNYIYPAFKCGCRERTVLFCSYEILIIAEVKQNYPDLIKYYNLCRVYQHLYSPQSFTDMTKRLREQELFTKHFPDSICLRHGVSTKSAKYYFQLHTNLISIVPSYVGSFVPEIRHEKCVKFYCRLKGFIPVGENHFPLQVVTEDGTIVKTKIEQGYLQFASQKLRVGDAIESVSMKGTLGGFLQFYDRVCFMTCAHVVLDEKSMISKKQHPIHKKDLRIFAYDTQGQRIECGKVMQCIFEPGTDDKPGIDVAVIEIKNPSFTIDPNDIVIDSAGDTHSFVYLGMSDEFLNDNFVDYELLTLGKVYCETMAFGSQKKIEKCKTKFELQNLVEIDLSLGQATAVFNGNNIFPVTVASPAHMQQILGTLPKQTPFRMYNQMCLNIPLVAGDSGSCVYIKDFQQSGCLGMAIAFVNGLSIVTPMKCIFDRIS